jgi:uncharacterized FlgJ-related protein
MLFGKMVADELEVILVCLRTVQDFLHPGQGGSKLAQYTNNYFVFAGCARICIMLLNHVRQHNCFIIKVVI